MLISYTVCYIELLMKCKDISDKEVLKFLQNENRWCTYGKGYSMPTVQSVMPKDTPVKLQLAKMKQLIKRGLADGCTCGCRGDFEITDKGVGYINSI